jgi:hypothetical protein
MIRPGGSGAGAAVGPVDSLSWRPWSTPGRAPDGALPRAGAPLCLIKALGGGGLGGVRTTRGMPSEASPAPSHPPIQHNYGGADVLLAAALAAARCARAWAIVAC